MILANLGLVALLSVSSMGGPDHRSARRAGSEVCGSEDPAVLRQVQALRTSPRKGVREDAAEDLRKLDWRSHPEAVLALSDALVLDRSDDVREEAAESLGRMAPNVPTAHEALIRAAASDPDHGVRKKARKALASMGRRCVADCPSCGPLPTNSVIQGPVIIPPEWMPYLAPRTSTTPTEVPSPVDEPRLEALPPALPDSSPLSDTPPPPPSPVRLEGPVGSNVKTSGSVKVRVR